MLDYQLAPDYRFLKFNDIKKGSKLLVKSLKWYEKNKNEEGNIYIGSVFIEIMKKFCEKNVTVKSFHSRIFHPGGDIYNAGCQDAAILIEEDEGRCTWSLGMFQGIKVLKNLDLE